MRWVLNVPCPHCRAGIGQACQSWSTRALLRTAPHIVRWDLHRAIRGR